MNLARPTSILTFALLAACSREAPTALQPRTLLAGAEYHATLADGGLQAPNRQHGFRARFDGRGVSLHDRESREAQRLTRLELHSLGRGAVSVPVTEGVVRHEGPRVEIERAGVTEWYVNGREGLEQGFTLDARPQTGGEDELFLELAVEGAAARAVPGGIELDTDEGRTLRYDKLVTFDACGDRLDSRMAVVDPGRIRLFVRDAGAQYPLTIDPLLQSVPDAFIQSNQPDPVGFLPSAFGGCVASAGDVNGDGFGDVIVGAPGWDGGLSQEGAAFIFLGGPNGITATSADDAQVRLEGNQFGAQFGTVSGAGDVNGDGFDDVIVGAHFYESLLPGTQLEVNGAAFVFLGSPTGIVGTGPADAHAAIFSNELSADLGLTVAGAGDVNGDGFDDVLVSVPDHGTPFPPGIPPNQMSGDIGAALLFHGSAQGITGTGFDDADTVLLPHEDTGAPLPPIYGSIGSVAPAGDINADGFADVLVSGSEIAVFFGRATGIPHSDITMADVRIQPGGPMGFSPFGLFATAAGDVNGDGFGDLVASSPFRDAWPFSTRREGVFFLFHGSATGIAATDTTMADTTVVGTLLAEWLGARVGTAGDVDGDGFDDIVVAAREYAGSLTNEGAAYLFRGSPAGIAVTSTLQADARIDVPQENAVVLGNNAAFDVATAGDVNGDGRPDIILGKGYWDEGEENEGAAFVFHGQDWPANPNIPPVADAGPDRNYFDLDADGSELVMLDAGGSFDPDGSIVSYTWRDAGQVIGTGAQVAVLLATSGDHEISLSVTDDQGLSRGDTTTVRIELLGTTQQIFEGFSNGLGGWTTLGDVTLVNDGTFPEAPQVRLGAAGSILRRTIPVPADSVGAELSFWAKPDGYAPGDTFVCRLGPAGGPLTEVLTLDVDDSGSGYLFYGGSVFPIGVEWFPANVTDVTIEFESFTTTGETNVDLVRLMSVDVPEMFEPFCFGDGDCTPCPCGNDAPVGAQGGCLNSSGDSGVLSASGIASVSLDSLSFEAASLNPMTFAVLVSAQDRLPVGPLNPCFGQDTGVSSLLADGLRCVGGNLRRHGVRLTDAAGSVGASNAAWGFPTGPALLSAFGVGETRHFQAFYRQDVMDLCGTGQSTTNAVTVYLLP